MAVADFAIRPLAPVGNPRVAPCERRGDALYPPRIVPHDKPPSSLAYLRDMVRDPLLALSSDAFEEPVVVRSWPGRVVAACAPEIVKTVLVDRREDFRNRPPLQRYLMGRLVGRSILLAEDADWRWQKKTTAPLFRHSEILKYVPVMSDAALAMIKRWRPASGSVCDVAADMALAAYEVIGRTILIGGSKKITQEMSREGQRHRRALRWATAFCLLRYPEWLPRPGRVTMNRRDANLRRIVDDMIEAYRVKDGAGDDLLGRLVAARHPDTGEAMAHDQLIDNILAFTLAGHLTTSNALTWTLYLIACAPEWEARLLDEIHRVVPEGPVTADHVDKLILVQQVLKEALRLFPPIAFQNRIAVRDTELGGRKVQKGTFITVPTYAVHRHKTAWADPDRFDPNRFAEGAEPRANSCKFLPFGAGPRVCIGSTFALIEATVFLATFLRAAKFALPTPDFVPIPSAGFVLTPKYGMPLAITLRS